MSIPSECTVLVVGGGPAGSYAASVLAREGINTVLLEADIFPRYHIGESLIPSVRYFLDFIDAYEKFNNHGFLRKDGATFKFNSRLPGYTDFVAAGGAGNHSWNVIRSEADLILFKHAGESGAIVFDGVKVNSIEFVHHDRDQSDPEIGLGRPVSASWSQKDGSCGKIHFKYLIDASGRAGLVSTKYMKNRRYNQGMKSTAIWGYWEGGGTYGPGIGDPLSEAIQDGSGWAWYIPLHDNTVSVGITIKQDRIGPKKAAKGSPSSQVFYLETLKGTTGIANLLQNAQLKTEPKTTSDWSYNAAEYASPYLRIAGDAGCFVDPLYSSGVHLAMNSGFSAAVTICAALRGDCTEEQAVEWHSTKVAETYTRFLLVVKSSLEQIHGREENLLNDLDEPGFDKAFEHFKPIIQGTVDAGGKLTKTEIARSVDFCKRVIEKVETGCFATVAANAARSFRERGSAATYTADEKCDTTLMNIVHMHRVLDMDNFTVDVINGMAPNVKRGVLGLVKAM